jgi:uncharacterized protein YkwD
MKKHSAYAAATSAGLMAALALGMVPASAATAAPAAAPAAVAAASYSDSFAKQTFDLMNAERSRAGVRPLVWHQSIANVSQDWSAHLGSATAKPGFNMANIHRWDGGGSLIPAGASWYREIIAFNVSARAIVDFWMSSSDHRAIMLDPRATHGGLGYVIPTSGPHKGRYMVVSNLAAYPGSSGSSGQGSASASGPFWDTGSSGFIKEITWMKSRSITTGWPNGSFRPLDAVNRESMAAFMYRMAGSPAYTPPRTSPFADVPTNHMYYKEIAWMHAKEISTGWPDRTFRPYEPVRRESMGAFMHRYAASVCGVNRYAYRSFTDMNTSIFANFIAWMGGHGISTGHPDGSFRPYEAVNRESMAAFMYRLDGHIKAYGGC